MCADSPRSDAGGSLGSGLSFSTVPAPAHTRFGPIRRFGEIDSTNRYLLDEARAGAPEGLVAVADYQSAGRGRLGRRWEAPPGANLLASVLLRPMLEPEELHLCTVAVALAATAACERGAGVVPDLKWPNDLLVRGRKLAGILAEAVPAGSGPGRTGPGRTSGGGMAVVVGLGLNVGWPPPDTTTLPTPVPDDAVPDDAEPDAPDPDAPDPDAPDPGDTALSLGGSEEPALVATSIWREARARPDPLAMLTLVLEELEGRLADLADAHGRRRLSAEYRRRCVTVGKEVRVSLPAEVLTGTATDITAEGHLIVDVGTGLRSVAAGDVVHLRDPA